VNQPLARRNSAERFSFLRAMCPAWVLTRFLNWKETFREHAGLDVRQVWRGTQVVREEPAKLSSWVRFPSAPPILVRGNQGRGCLVAAARGNRRAPAVAKVGWMCIRHFRIEIRGLAQINLDSHKTVATHHWHLSMIFHAHFAVVPTLKRYCCLCI
jgi:hypothetical protein